MKLKHGYPISQDNEWCRQNDAHSYPVQVFGQKKHFQVLFYMQSHFYTLDYQFINHQSIILSTIACCSVDVLLK